MKKKKANKFDANTTVEPIEENPYMKANMVNYEMQMKKASQALNKLANPCGCDTCKPMTDLKAEQEAKYKAMATMPPLVDEAWAMKYAPKKKTAKTMKMKTFKPVVMPEGDYFGDLFYEPIPAANGYPKDNYMSFSQKDLVGVIRGLLEELGRSTVGVTPAGTSFTNTDTVVLNNGNKRFLSFRSLIDKDEEE